MTRPRLTVDLGAIAANYTTLAALAPGGSVAAAVKADAYGLGMSAVAPVFWQCGARQFCVADQQEGLELRSLLPDAEILVLGGYREGTERHFREARLTPVLNTPEEAVRCAEVAPGMAACVMIDTGMTRLGLHPGDLGSIDHALDRLSLRWIMSHLASADDRDAAQNAHQQHVFDSLQNWRPTVPRSFANSSGLFLGRTFHGDLVRPGIALYGGNPTPGAENPMQSAVSLQAPILQIHRVHSEAVVGYGATYRASAGSRIATAAIGYGDGLLRSASNRAKALVAGVEVPVAGRISMDLIGLDVSALPENRLRVGDPAWLLWGPDGIDRMAQAADTIPYEVLVRLGGRVERAYEGGGRA